MNPSNCIRGISWSLRAVRSRPGQGRGRRPSQQDMEAWSDGKSLVASCDVQRPAIRAGLWTKWPPIFRACRPDLDWIQDRSALDTEIPIGADRTLANHTLISPPQWLPVWLLCQGSILTCFSLPCIASRVTFIAPGSVSVVDGWPAFLNIRLHHNPGR